MQQDTRWTFAGFDIDVKASVLRKNGVPVRIGRQAFCALALLVSKGGQLVTREELQKEIWGDRVHVDFEHGLNVCIRQVRAALGNDAEGNQIIVTCPREGYRLAVSVKRVTAVAPAAVTRWPSLPRWRAAAAAAAIITAGYVLAPSVIGNHRPISSASASDPNGIVETNGDFGSDGVATLSPALFSRPSAGLVEAAEWYWRGRGYYDRSSAGKPFRALPYFERAVALDPNFALAQAGLAVAYVDRATAGVAPMESATKATQAVQRALALNSKAAEAHVASAEISYRLHNDDHAAQSEFARAVELDGRSVYVRQRYAAYLEEHKRFDDALEQLRIAEEQDPLSVRSSWLRADTLFAAHRYNESLAETYHTLELDPDHVFSFRNVGRCLEALGRRSEAIEAYLNSGRVGLGQLGRVYAVVGRLSEAREILNILTRQPVEESRNNGVAIAYIYTGLGEPAKAVEWLKRAHQQGVRLPFSIRVAPEWEPLRTSHAFQEFLQKNPIAGTAGT